MSDALDQLLSILDLEQIEVDIFRGRSPQERRQRVFGGQVAGQALVAAGRTVERGRVHSLHAYFLRPGDPFRPILYEVDQIRDGGSFTTRRVVAKQKGKAIFNLSASFHVDESGVEHQSTMPDVPSPDVLPTLVERMEPVRSRLSPEALEWYLRPRPLEMRYVTPLRSYDASHPSPVPQQVWMKADGVLPDDQLLHACVIAYASDMSLLSSAMLPHNISWDDEHIMSASLDHAMWFHRPMRADEWFLYDQISPIAHGARGFALGSIFDAAGNLAVSVAQEGLVRILDPSTQRHHRGDGSQADADQQ